MKKFAFTIVCVYNRLRVDGAFVLVLNERKRPTNHTYIFPLSQFHALI